MTEPEQARREAPERAQERATHELPRPAEATSLLSNLLRQPLDPGYADAARRRAAFGPRTGWRSRAARSAMLLVLVLAGLLLSIAYQQVVLNEPEATRAKKALAADVRSGHLRATDVRSSDV